MVHRDARGFSLVEALVALMLLGTGAALLAHLCAYSTRALVDARRLTTAVVFARAKLEELRALPVDLDLSPPGSLDADADGFCDFLGRDGDVLSVHPPPPPGAVYVRRWSIAASGGEADAPLIVHVVAGERFGDQDLRRAGTVRLATILRRPR